MKVVISSVWASARSGQPNVYLTLEPESATEKALAHSLYYCRPKVVQFTDGKVMLDFYPKKVAR